MRRPSEITREQVLRWRERWQADENFHPGQRTPAVREAYYATEWLSELLVGMGLSEEERSDIRFANEQKCVELPDPWAATLETLAEVRAGTPPRPGPELSMALMKRTKRVGDWQAMLEHFVTMGYAPEYVNYLLDLHRDEPMEGPRPAPVGRHASLFEPLYAAQFPNVRVDRVLAIYRRMWDRRHQENR